MAQLSFNITEQDILRFLYRKNCGEHILTSTNGLIAQVIQDQTKMRGILLNNNFYFRSSRYSLENISNDVIIRAEAIELSGIVAPFSFEVEYTDNVPF